MSKEYYKYLKKKRLYKITIIFLQILIFLCFIFIWQLLCNLKLIDSFIFSSPSKIISTTLMLFKSNILFNNIFITIYETIISFIIGMLLGIIIASILWYFKWLSDILDPYLTIINSLPKIALGPIIIIWGGAGIKSIIIMALLISTIITIINVLDGFRKTDSNMIKLLKTFKANRLQIFFKLVLPYNYKTIISTLKINISMTLIGVIMGEFLVSKNGIGYLIMYGSQVFNLNLVMTGIFILCIMSSIMYYLVLFIEKMLIRANKK